MTSFRNGYNKKIRNVYRKILFDSVVHSSRIKIIAKKQSLRMTRCKNISRKCNMDPITAQHPDIRRNVLHTRRYIESSFEFS